ncbi:hypothetical protein L596_011633 [Steinernema carpocapsae]|uniref:J domain-containing protein n=1 Tax=Steinernema carpocapsae TaxID=34508 RepID=A0A4U5NUI8_STECR|nr:hypothetical protein L596_011633 [Steinernema carpocapsae]
MNVTHRRCFSFSSALCRTYYDILGVDRTATTKDIKNAYYTLSKKYHPDATGAKPGDSTLRKFLELSDAYDILKDSEKRRIYDSQISASANASYYYDNSYANRNKRRTYSEDEVERIWKQYQDATRRNAPYETEWPFGSNRYARNRRPGTTHEFRRGPGWSYKKTTHTDKDGNQSTSYTFRDTDGTERTVHSNPISVNWDLLGKIFKVYMIAFFGVTVFQIFYGQAGSIVRSNREEWRRREEAFKEQQEKINRMMNAPPVPASAPVNVESETVYPSDNGPPR